MKYRKTKRILASCLFMFPVFIRIARSWHCTTNEMSVKLAINIGTIFKSNISGVSSNFFHFLDMIPFLAKIVKIKAPILGRHKSRPRWRKLVLTSWS